VDAKFSPALCKLLLGRPLHFLDLLHSNQELFQDLLKLMMLPPDAVTRLRLTLPGTSATAAGGDTSSWDGRGQKQGTLVTVENRLEYLYRKVEGALFGRAKPQVSLDTPAATPIASFSHSFCFRPRRVTPRWNTNTARRDSARVVRGDPPGAFERVRPP
jgi:hypothetical protein